jgi:hypothetical protein
MARENNIHTSSPLSKTTRFWSPIHDRVSVTNQTSGTRHHQDCSAASCAILDNLSILASLFCLMTDLCAGQNHMAATPISVNF